MAFQDGGICQCKVHQNQTVNDVAESWIPVEAEHDPIEFEVMLEQNGDPFPVGLDLRNQCGNVVDVFRTVSFGISEEMLKPARTVRLAGLHHF